MKARPGQLIAQVIAAILVAIYAWVVWLPDPDAESEEQNIELAADAPTVVDIRPHSAAPGATIVVHYELPEGEAAPERVTATVLDAQLELLEHKDSEAIFRLADDAPVGPNQLVLSDGQRASPPYGFVVEPVSYRKIMRNLLGGLGFVLLGLVLLSKALRRRADRALRRRIGGLTASPVRTVALGTGAGALTQSSTATAAIVLPFLERPLLNFESALRLLVGAHLGAALIGAALPLAGTKHAPLVIAVGVILRLASKGRRERASANLIIGIGVLLQGIYMLRAGFAPLAEQPSLLLELRHIQPNSLWGLLLAAALGAGLGVATQGPGPVFVLVLSVAQATSLLSLPQALAFLAAAPVGSALGTLLLSSTMTKEARRLALAQLLIALWMLVISWILLPFLPGWVALVLDGDPTAIAHGKKTLHPDMAIHLAASFVAMQGLATLASLPLVRPLSTRMRPATVRPVTRDLTGKGPSLVNLLEEQRRALDAAQLLWQGDAEALMTMEGHLQRARTLGEKQLERDPRLREENQDGILISVMALQHSLEYLRGASSRLQRNGWTLEGAPLETISEMHNLVRQGLTGAIQLMKNEDGPSIDQLRSREIDTNSREAELRKTLETQMRELKGNKARRLLLCAELAGAYEGMGNQLYRLGTSLAPDDDDF